MLCYVDLDPVSHFLNFKVAHYQLKCFFEDFYVLYTVCLFTSLILSVLVHFILNYIITQQFSLCPKD